MTDDPRPNIVLITTDQQRYDTLGANGSSWIRTPHLDDLATRGTNFRNTIIQNPVCIPSRACLQTGRYTHQHGVEYMEKVIDDTPGLPPWETTFMERLQVAGYYTAAFGKVHMMPERGFHEQQVTGGKGARWTKSAGLEIGLGPLGRDYAVWLETRRPGGYEAIYEQRRQPHYGKYRTAISNVLALEHYVDYWVAENTIDLIGRDHAQPFFVWCGFCGPHPPIDPPAPYDSMYSPGEIDLPPNFPVDENGSPRAVAREEEEMVRRWCAYYGGLVTLIDDMVGRIISALEAQAIGDNTLILFTSDHGEMMFELGRTGKGNFYEPVIRVPLIVVPPQATGEHRGSEVEDVTEMFDIAPTILDYARAEIPQTMSASSLRPLVEGTGGGKEAAFCEYMTNDRSRQGICVRTQRYKYAYWGRGGEEQFFDLHDDPLERRNRMNDPACRDQIADLRLLVIDRLIHTGSNILTRSG